jgi:hypothetical protein
MPITLLQPFNLDTTAAYTVAQITATGNVTGGNLNVSGNIVDTGALSIVTGSNGNLHLAPNGTGIVTASSALSAVGNITGGNLLTAGLISATGSLTIGTDFNMSGNIIDTGVLWLNTSANGNINLNPNGTGQTNIPTGILSVTANITGGNLLTAGLISATANVQAGNLRTAGLISATANITGGNLLTAGLISATANIQAGNLRTAGLISATGAITGAAITGSSLTVSTGNVSAGNIVNTNANGVGNIGNATVYFNTVFGKATTAQYADLAEMYSADATYKPGTVLDFGGNQEVTLSTAVASNRVAGVVSTNPAHLMNSVLTGEYPVAVALTGRVPTSVTGTVSKGDMMVSGGNGVAMACARPEIGAVIGKSLENFSGDSGVIEIVVGRL